MSSDESSSFSSNDDHYDFELDCTTSGSVVNPFSETGYAVVSKLTHVECDRVEKDPETGHFVHNPHNVNSASKYSFRPKISKSIGERVLDEELLDAVASKRDVMYLKQRPDSCHDTQLTSMAAHCLNHLLQVRDNILKGNMKLAKDPSAEIRDQGFTRPRILFVCPFKNTAYKFVTALMELWSGERGDGDGGQVEQKRRFHDEYGRVVDSDGEEVEEDLSERPLDYQHTFAGNIDDCFRIGIKMTRKALKLYADFYSADILVVSPLGLKLVMDGQDQSAARGNKSKNKNKRSYSGKRNDDDDKKHRKPVADSDYLSSVECVIVDQCDVIAMQNWEHLVEIFERLNQLPKESHGCDFSRVMNVFLDKKAHEMRQSVFLSQYGFPDLAHLFHTYCRNVLGWEQFDNVVYEAVLSVSKLKPEFHILPPIIMDPTEVAEQRLSHFEQQILPQLANQNHCLIVVSNYFEYLQVKQVLEDKHQHVSFSAISEYSEQKEVTRARSRFFDGHSRLLLTTERMHFFHRFTIKSVKRLVFYALPMNAVFVKEFVEMVRVREGVRIAPIVLLSRLDWAKVERVFGTKNVAKIFSS